MTTTDDVTVLIAPTQGSPGIPMDVFTTITKVIGLAYPNAQMGPGETEFGRTRGYTLIVNDADRAPRTKVGQRAAAKAFTPRVDPDDMEVLSRGFDGERLQFATPERVSMHLAVVGMMLLDGMNEASNYVEIPAHHPNVGDILVTVARSQGQTPHALRQEAEAKLAAVLKLHRPDRPDDDPDDPGPGQCEGCLEVDPGGHAPWPCPTAIAAGATP